MYYFRKIQPVIKAHHLCALPGMYCNAFSDKVVSHQDCMKFLTFHIDIFLFEGIPFAAHHAFCRLLGNVCFKRFISL